MARDAGLTMEDLCTMTYAQVDSWVELHQWLNSPDDNADGERMDAQAGRNAFFHLG